jgi:hypothetical protein
VIMGKRKKEIFSVIGWSLVFLCIGVNLYYLSKPKIDILALPPLNDIDIEKPTLVLILNEYECASCVSNLLFLNRMYSKYRCDGEIDFLGIIMSEDLSDQKELQKAFDFPFVISDNFQVFKRLNINRTPLIVGISKNYRIVYFELIPQERQLSESYIRKGVLDRLYYSNFF